MVILCKTTTIKTNSNTFTTLFCKQFSNHSGIKRCNLYAEVLDFDYF